ncbi:Detected protein of unknown function [Hibiscus syriacus]|uniref:DDE Tnp4 domain-containing protein n=1 Tax=Hibiscus syriacus TaxID=106335 RepID=A0A6A2ZVR5_HIBSY|nr:Detected protein of unknown function [Hibiscus syriacus]
MKNAYDNLKAKYIGWVYLKNKTGNLYNQQTNTFTLTNEEWEEFRKGHPKAASLKTIPLSFPELCTALFNGNSATGNCKWTSTQTTLGVESSSCHHVQPLLITNNPFIDSENNDGTSHEPPSKPVPNTSVDPPLSASVDPPPESSPTFDRPSKRAKTSKSSSDKTVVTFDDIAVYMQKALQHIVKNKDGPTSVECYEKLKLCNLDPIDPIFLAAFHIFGLSIPMRDAWMTLSAIRERGTKRMRDNNLTMSGHQYTLELLQGAVGALDGTLIHVVVPANKQDLYSGMGKGDCYQNVLAICDFNMIFTFIVAGWEGVAHDARILSEALADPDAPFPFPPPDKYYLCDAAYAHIQGFMAPYRNVRYWLGDFRHMRALTNKEKFNHAHAKLRNIIERVFGVLKARFPILKRMTPFPLITQRNITISCFAIHNFIRKEGLSDEFFNEYDQPNVTFQNTNVCVADDEDEPEGHGSAADREYMTQLRDEIAEQLMQNMD